MSRAIVLDSGPLGYLCSVSNKKGRAFECKKWASDLLDHKCLFIVLEISDYEVRRELIRAELTESLLHLDSLKDVPGFQYLALNTTAMRKAAELWAFARQLGQPAASDKALDADVILAAQVLTFGDPEIVIATTNVEHLSRFTPAKEWRQITKS